MIRFILFSCHIKAIVFAGHVTPTLFEYAERSNMIINLKLSPEWHLFTIKQAKSIRYSWSSKNTCPTQIENQLERSAPS